MTIQEMFERLLVEEVMGGDLCGRLGGTTGIWYGHDWVFWDKIMVFRSKTWHSECDSGNLGCNMLM